MRDTECPKCGRKFKVAPMGKRQLLVIPQESTVIDDCPECGHLSAGHLEKRSEQ